MSVHVSTAVLAAELAALLDQASPELRVALGNIADDCHEHQGAEISNRRYALVIEMRRAGHRAVQATLTLSNPVTGTVRVPVQIGERA